VLGKVSNVSISTLPDRALDRAYLIPRDTASIEDWNRRRHLDLAAMDAVALDTEAFRVMARLAYEPNANRRAWLIERRDAVHAERQRRAGRAHRADPGPTAIVWDRPRSRPAPRSALNVRKRGGLVAL